VILSVITDTPPRVSTLRSDVAPAIDALVVKALAKDPAQRFQTAEEMRAAMLGALR